jgi:uncharacterized membrane protein
LFNRSLAIFAVAILAVSPLAITMASELKPYSRTRRSPFG